MKTIQLFSYEVKRLINSPMTWLTALLTILSPLLGLILYRPATADTMLSLYLANPALAGGAAGGVLFGLLTIFELDRANRSRVDVLVDAAVSPLRMAFVRLLALMAAGLLTLGAAMLIWLPVTWFQTGAVFGLTDYCLAYLIFMGLALPLSILAGASAYQFTRRLDLSLVLFAGFAGLSLTVWADQWQLCWLNPCVWALSDDFSNFRVFRSAAYMRLTWLSALAGAWSLSYLCIRQYGKGIFGSLAHSVRRVYRPVTALALAAAACAAYALQPMVDQSNPDPTVMTFDLMEYAEGLTCSGRSVRLFPDTDAGTLKGTAAYQFQNTSGKEQTAAFGINPGYRVSSVLANGQETEYSVGDYQEFNEALLEITIPAQEEVEIQVEYGGYPREENSLSTMQGSDEISNEYICLTNGTLTPRLINVMPAEEGIPVTVEVTLPAHMTAVPFSSATAQVISENEDGTATWCYEDPAAGTGGILYAGDYICQDIEAGGISIQLYYGRKHQSIMESAGAVEAVQAVADYCTEHYGPLSYAAGGSLKLIQSRVTGGGYAVNGASLLDEADFTSANLRDGDKGSVPGEVFIHELVHQWWGLANMFDPTADESGLWSAEGLTVYTTYRIVKELYGEDYARKHFVNQWEQEVEDYYLNYYVRNPEYLSVLPAEKQGEISGSLSQVRQYSEMPLKILKAETLVGGEEAMDQILKELFNRELDYTYPYLTYQEFLEGCELTEEDLNLG